MRNKIILAAALTLAASVGLAKQGIKSFWPFSAPVVDSEASVAIPEQGNVIFDYSTSTTGSFKGYNGSSWVEFASANGNNANVRAVSSTDSTDSSDDVVLLSGSSFVLTLHSAASNLGQTLQIQHAGTSLTQVYTLNTTSGQTIGGIASGSYALYTNGEVLKLVSDGSNWVILDHKTDTAWVDAGTNTVTATTTNPVKGTTSIDKIYWRRTGQNVQVRIEYQQTAAGSGTSGTGDYLFAIPANISIDTSLVTAYSTVEGGGIWTTTNNVGSFIGVGIAGANQFNVAGGVVVYDSGKVRFAYVGVDGASNAGLGFGGSAALRFNYANTGYHAEFTVPVSGWRP